MTKAEKHETLRMFKNFPKSVKMTAALSVKLAELVQTVKGEYGGTRVSETDEQESA